MSDDRPVRLRFAHSPSGSLHVGGARSALFNWLHARQKGGSFILRVEDTDRARSSMESIQAIDSAMTWLGLDWDEGPGVGGDYGPYFQSERKSFYQEATQQLLDSGHAYKCYCSPETLEQMRSHQESNKLPIQYDGRCRDATPEAMRAAEAAGVMPSIRFRVPAGEMIVPDRVKGDVRFDLGTIGDFVIMRSTGNVMYNMACVVDDASMEISLVIRGDEHLVNTPRQIMIYEALGRPVPVFAHMPVILGTDGKKMSKRFGETSVARFKEDGFLSAAMVNYLALLGWSGGDDTEEYSVDQLKEAFSLERVMRSPAIFDITKLKWVNGLHIKRTPAQSLVAMIEPGLVQAFGHAPPRGVSRETFLEMVDFLKPSMTLISDAPVAFGVFYREEGDVSDEGLEIMKSAERAGVLCEAFAERLEGLGSFDHEAVKSQIKAVGTELELKGQNLFPILRIGATGLAQGPDLVRIICLNGRSKTVSNLRAAAALLK